MGNQGFMPLPDKEETPFFLIPELTDQFSIQLLRSLKPLDLNRGCMETQEDLDEEGIIPGITSRGAPPPLTDPHQMTFRPHLVQDEASRLLSCEKIGLLSCDVESVYKTRDH